MNRLKKPPIRSIAKRSLENPLGRWLWRGGHTRTHPEHGR